MTVVLGEKEEEECWGLGGVSERHLSIVCGEVGVGCSRVRGSPSIVLSACARVSIQDEQPKSGWTRE